MNSNSTIALYRGMRQTMAVMLSVLLVPAAQLELHAQAPAPAYVELDAVQLDQIVAPIALYPDSLVAQILTGATYPDQIAAADTWLNQNMNLPPDQRAAGANAQTWDPAIKGLTAFPAVLDNLAKNTAWASQLGNAYYNQPGDVMNAVQAMRLQAQQSNRLVTTTQQRVVVDAGLITIVPVNPAVVYVPYYNPWAVWGGLFTPYPGFVVVAPPVGIVLGVGLAFGVGIGIGVFGGFGWGFNAWRPGWGGGTILYGGNTYISNSVTVYNHGSFGGHDRGAFEHGGRGVPGGFHAAAHAGAARAEATRTGADRAAANRAAASRGGAAGGARGGAAGGGRSAFAGGARGGAPAGGARGGAAGGARGGAAGGARAGAARGGAPAARGGGAAGGARGGAAAGGARGGAAAGGARGGAAAGGARGGAPAARGGAAAGGARGGAAAGGARGGAAGGARGGAPAARGGGAAGGARGGAPAARGGGGGARGGAPAARGGGGGARPAGGGGGRKK